MSQNSPEQSFSLEQQEWLTELEFINLQIGDEIMLHFPDGTAGWLLIDHQDETENYFAKIKWGRKSQLATEIEEWEDHPHHIKLMGSCQRLKVEQGQVFVIGENPGSFVVGECAWYVFASERGEKNQISPIIHKIELIKANESEKTTDETEIFDTIDLR